MKGMWPRDRGAEMGPACGFPLRGVTFARKLQPTDAKKPESRPHRRTEEGTLTPAEEAMEPKRQ